MYEDNINIRDDGDDVDDDDDKAANMFLKLI